MVNENKSRQNEGYDVYDSDLLAFNVAGGAETFYVAGTNQNALIAGAWPSDSGLFAVSLLTANVAIGAVAVPVANGALFVVGQTVRIVDSANHMDNVIAVIVGNVLTMALPSVAAFTLANGAAVYSLLPDNAQNTILIATAACFIRFRNKELLTRQTRLRLGQGGGLPAGLPVQIPLQANTFYVFPDKWVILNAVGQGAAAGVLTIIASG